MIRLRDEGFEVKIVKVDVERKREGITWLNLRAVPGNYFYTCAKPADLVATGGFCEIGKAMFKEMK